MDFLAELNLELTKAVAPTAASCFGTTLTPIETLVNRPVSARPYVDILLKYLPISDNRTKEFIAFALTEKGMTAATQTLLDLFQHDLTLQEPQRWVLGRALYVIDDPRSYPDILRICKVQKYRSSRAMLMHTLAKIRSEEAFDVLISSLDDPTVRADALEALGEFGDAHAIPHIGKTQVTEGLREFDAKKKALAFLRGGVSV